MPSDRSEAKFNRYVKQINDSLYSISDYRLSDSTLSMEGTIKIDLSKVGGLPFFNHRGKKKGVTAENESYNSSSVEGRHIKHGLFKKYYASGDLKWVGNFVNNSKNGQFEYWYENGSKKQVLNYSDSLKNPPFYQVLEYYDSLGNHLVSNGIGTYTYTNKIIQYESGQVIHGLKNGVWKGKFLNKYTFEEIYIEGEFKSGFSTDTLGRKVHYKRLESQAKYKGGSTKLYEFVGSNLKYPAKARRNGIQGRVFIQFVVDKQGNTRDVTIIKGIYPECDKLAKMIIESANNFIPGTMKGVPVKQRMIIPITFSY